MLFEQILLGKPIQPGKKNLFPTDNEYPTSAHGILPRQLASCEHKKQKQPKKSEDQQQKNTDDQKQSQQEKQTIRMTEHSLWFDNEENVTEDDYCQNSQQQELFETFIQTQVLDYNQSTKAKYSGEINEDEGTAMTNFEDENCRQVDIEGQFQWGMYNLID